MDIPPDWLIAFFNDITRLADAAERSAAADEERNKLIVKQDLERKAWLEQEAITQEMRWHDLVTPREGPNDAQANG